MEIVHLLKVGLLIALQLSIPPLITAIISGVLLSLFQTLFQIQDQTLPFAVKLIAVGMVLSMTASWFGSELIEYFGVVFLEIQNH